MADAIRVKGLQEVVRTFNKANRTVSRSIQAGLKKDVEPVTQSAKEKIGRYRGAKVGTIRPRASGASVFVRQNAKKVDGRHANFGALQMRRMDEALEENKHEVERNIENTLDRFLEGIF